MKQLSIDDLKEKQLIVLECLSGSRAYGLDSPQSDTDIRGVFILPEAYYFGFNYIDQVSNETNDIVYYELTKYLQLLAKNNPTAIELLFAPKETIFIRDAVLDIIDTTQVVSLLCKDTFAGYAQSQVKRSKSLNKKIFNPKMGEYPNAIDFCYVVYNEKTIPVVEWLTQEKISMNDCGLSALPHIKDGYALFYAPDSKNPVMFNGLFNSLKKIDSKTNSQDVCLSSIPYGMKPRTWLFFNKDNYSKQFNEYHEYNEWVKSRNPIRYESTMLHGKGYDAKNMMHTFRLLKMALEIAKKGVPDIFRNDRDELLAIKRGDFQYDYLLEKASNLILEIYDAFTHSNLPLKPNIDLLEMWGVQIRSSWYQNKK